MTYLGKKNFKFFTLSQTNERKLVIWSSSPLTYSLDGLSCALSTKGLSSLDENRSSPETAFATICILRSRFSSQRQSLYTGQVLGDFRIISKSSGKCREHGCWLCILWLLQWLVPPGLPTVEKKHRGLVFGFGFFNRRMCFCLINFT